MDALHYVQFAMLCLGDKRRLKGESSLVETYSYD